MAARNRTEAKAKAAGERSSIKFICRTYMTQGLDGLTCHDGLQYAI